MSISDHHIIIDGLNTCYRVAGDKSNQSLIFLHGWGARKNDIFGRGTGDIMQRLSEKFYVVALELPGHIRSEPPREIWGFEEYAKFLNEFVGVLQIQKPAIIMGQSFGGGVATQYAFLYPSEVKALILTDSTQTQRPENFYYRTRFWWRPFFKETLKNSFVPTIFKKIVISLFTGVPFGFLQKHSLLRYGIMADIQCQAKLKGDYAKFHMPVLLMWGRRDSMITPIVRAREIAKEIPRVKFIELNGGHLALFQDTQRAISEIFNFYT